MNSQANILICRNGVQATYIESEEILYNAEIKDSHMIISRKGDNIVYGYNKYISKNDHYRITIQLNNIFIISLNNLYEILLSEIDNLIKTERKFYDDNATLLENLTFKETFDILRRSVLAVSVERIENIISKMDAGSFSPMPLNRGDISGIKIHTFNDKVEDIIKNISLYSAVLISEGEIGDNANTPYEICKKMDLQVKEIENKEIFVMPSKKAIYLSAIIPLIAIAIPFIGYRISLTKIEKEVTSTNQLLLKTILETDGLNGIYKILNDTVKIKHSLANKLQHTESSLNFAIAHIPTVMQKMANALYKEWGKEGNKIQILGNNPHHSKYCIGCYSKSEYEQPYYYDELWIHNLVSGITNKLNFGEHTKFKVEKLYKTNKKDRMNILFEEEKSGRFIYKEYGIIDMYNGQYRRIAFGDNITVWNGGVSSVNKQCTYEGEYMCDYEYKANIYRHYSNDGNVIILTENTMNCTGYDEDGDKVSMNIYIDNNGFIKGDYSAGLFTGYTLSGYQDKEGLLHINAIGNLFTKDTEFLLSAKSKGKLTGLRYGSGNRNYPLNLTY